MPSHVRRNHPIMLGLVASLASLSSLLPAYSHDEASGGLPSQFAPDQGDISGATGGTYAVEPNHAYIAATYSHLGFSRPVITFDDFEGTLTLDPDNLDATVIDVTINIDGIDSGVEVFDGHLKGEKFFNVAVYPVARFTSTAARAESNGHGKIAGDLTIKGITRPVVLDVVLHKAGQNPINKKETIGVSARTTIMRSDFEAGAYAPNVSDEVELTISTEFQKSE